MRWHQRNFLLAVSVFPEKGPAYYLRVPQIPFFQIIRIYDRLHNRTRKLQARVAIASIGKRTQSSAAFEPQHTPQPKLTGTTIKPGASANAASLPDFTGMRISKLCDLKNNYSRVLKNYLENGFAIIL